MSKLLTLDNMNSAYIDYFNEDLFNWDPGDGVKIVAVNKDFGFGQFSWTNSAFQYSLVLIPSSRRTLSFFDTKTPYTPSLVSLPLPNIYLLVTTSINCRQGLNLVSNVQSVLMSTTKFDPTDDNFASGSILPNGIRTACPGIGIVADYKDEISSDDLIKNIEKTASQWLNSRFNYDYVTEAYLTKIFFFLMKSTPQDLEDVPLKFKNVIKFAHKNSPSRTNWKDKVHSSDWYNLICYHETLYPDFLTVLQSFSTQNDDIWNKIGKKCSNYIALNDFIPKFLINPSLEKPKRQLLGGLR